MAQEDVVVDLRDCHFADSSLILDLAVLAHRLRKRGRRLHLRNPQPQISTLIEMTGIQRFDEIRLDA